MKHKSNKTRKVPFRVACLGNVFVDMLVKPVNRLPPPGGLLPVDSVEMAMGGCASNTAIALSRLGVPTSFGESWEGIPLAATPLKCSKRTGWIPVGDPGPQCLHLGHPGIGGFHGSKVIPPFHGGQ